MKLITFFASLLLSTQLFANTELLQQITPNYRLAALTASEWNPGDTMNYKVDMGILKGSMSMMVREIVERGVWLNQDVDMGPLGKQKIETLINPSTGEVLEMIVNGKRQDPPKPGNIEVIDQKEEVIKVPAGEFETIHVTIKDNDTNKTSEAWINPFDLPISGLVKSIQPGQLGKVKLDLTSYKFGKK